MNNKPEALVKGTRHNQVFAYILRNGANSRKAIAAALGLSTSSLTNITKGMIQDGVLYESSTLDLMLVGRKQILIDISPDFIHCIGIDITNTHIYTVIVNAKLEIIKISEWNFIELTEEYLNEAIEWIKSAINPEQDYLGMGVLGQGTLDETLFLNLPIPDALQRIRTCVNLDICTSNNITGLAITEALLNSEVKDFVLLHYSPGVSAVLVQGGVPISGAHGYAGEIAHSVWDGNSKQFCDVCKQYGCLEALLHFDRIASLIDPEGSYKNLSWQQMKELSKRDDDKALKRALLNFSKITGILVDFIDPEVIMISGEVFQEQYYFDCFVEMVASRNLTNNPISIKLINNYNEKKKKAAAAIVFQSII